MAWPSVRTPPAATEWPELAMSPGSRSTKPSTSAPVPAPTPRVDRLARVVLRPVGSPLPLGFTALGGASIVLSGLQLQWLPRSEAHQVGAAILLFAVPLELLAAVFGFLAHDSVGGTGMGVLAGTWLVTGTLLLMSPPGSSSRVLGLLLVFVAAALMVPTAAATSGKVAAAVVIFSAGVRFALTEVYELTGNTEWEHASGWWGVGVCLVALYAAMAFEIEDTRRRPVLPVGRRGAGRRALTGDLGDDLVEVRHEAGVREQL